MLCGTFEAQFGDFQSHFWGGTNLTSPVGCEMCGMREFAISTVKKQPPVLRRKIEKCVQDRN